MRQVYAAFERECAMPGEADQEQQLDLTAATATAAAAEAGTTMDPARTEAFLGRMVGILNDTSLALMCSIGHQTGLFDTMATLPPSTSAQLAAATGLNERYVREWLGAMVTGRIVEYVPDRATYALPPEHAAALTRAAGPNNLAGISQYFPLMGNVETQIIASFRQGGGVPYAAYPRFQQLQAEESAAIFDSSLLSTTLPLVPGLVERLRSGIDVLDVGCGQGHAINLMARAFPASRFTGLDFSDEGIERARAEAATWGLTTAHFAVQDVAMLGAPAQFDFITAFDCIHDQAHPRQVLDAVSAALRPSGVFLMVDVRASSSLQENMEHPMGPMLYTISCLHCMTVSLAQGGEGLGTVWGEKQATQLLRDAGFTHIEIQHQPADMLNSYYICTKS
jgi:2-polyprenyl-3-methyl-5-hydroxy-6-metoxy-1,4-benzoquinol methylase